KLTEGCVWSYNATSTGIMPEAFLVVPCESTKQCAWNETKYWEVLDPGAGARLVSYKQQMETYNEQMASASVEYEAALAVMTAAPSGTAKEHFEAVATPTPSPVDLQKRQLDVEPAGLPSLGATEELEQEDEEEEEV